MELRMGKKWQLRREGGFTMFNVAGLVVSAGLAMGVAVQGTDIVNNVKNEGFYADLRTMEDRVWVHKENAGYWPGDCNRDGVIGHQPGPSLDAERLQALASEKATSGNCKTAAVEDMKAPFADMRVAGLGDSKENNLLFSKHSQGGFFQIGHVEHGDAQKNVIVAYNVPADIARWVDEKIDGTSDTALGRVRRADSDAEQWGSSNDGSVTLMYYFERRI